MILRKTLFNEEKEIPLTFMVAEGVWFLKIYMQKNYYKIL